MKFVAIIEYQDKEKVRALRSAHREYLRRFSKMNSCAAGPFADDEGALWVLEADTAAAAEEIVKGNPYVEAGAIVSWRIRPLAYWSAQQGKGSR